MLSSEDYADVHACSPSYHLRRWLRHSHPDSRWPAAVHPEVLEKFSARRGLFWYKSRHEPTLSERTTESQFVKRWHTVFSCVRCIPRGAEPFFELRQRPGEARVATNRSPRVGEATRRSPRDFLNTCQTAHRSCHCSGATKVEAGRMCQPCFCHRIMRQPTPDWAGLAPARCKGRDDAS